jgi:hypothetical protein
MRLPVGLIACCLLISGCVYGRSYPVAPVGPPFEGPVAIYLDGAPLPETFTEVAVVQAQGSPNIDDLLPVLQREAARLGCNAIINVRVHEGQATGMAVRVPSKGLASSP